MVFQKRLLTFEDVEGDRRSGCHRFYQKKEKKSWKNRRNKINQNGKSHGIVYGEKITDKIRDYGIRLLEENDWWWLTLHSGSHSGLTRGSGRHSAGCAAGSVRWERHLIRNFWPFPNNFWFRRVSLFVFLSETLTCAGWSSRPCHFSPICQNWNRAWGRAPSSGLFENYLPSRSQNESLNRHL